MLEAYLPLWKPCELDGGCSCGLLAREIDWSLPVFVSKVAVNFEVFADAFDYLEVYVIQRGSTWHQARSLGNNRAACSGEGLRG